MILRLAATLLVLAAPLALAQDQRAMTVVDMLEVPRIGDPRLSPDGTALLYTRTDADWEENRRVTHIHRIGADGTGDVRLTNGERGESSPRWSPDGFRIAFLARRGETRQIHVIPASGGEAEALTDFGSAIRSFEFAPDGSIFFSAPEPKTADEKRREERGHDVFAFDEDYRQIHLHRVGADGETERITSGDFSVIAFRLSGDGGRVVHSRAPTSLLDNSDEGEIWIMDANGGNARQLTDNAVGERGGQLSPDGTEVLFTSASSAEFETYFNGNAFVVPAAGGPARILFEDFPYDVSRAEWAPDGSIRMLVNTGVRSQIFRAVEGDAPEPVTSGDHSVAGWHFNGDAHALGINTPTNAGDVHLLPDGGGEPAKATAVFDYLADAFRLPRQEAVQWEGEDGVMVEGLLYFPLGYEEGTRYPLVVQTHGGPRSSDKFGFGRWSSYVPVLAARGYMVFKPNYRGSTGYGDEFLRDMVGHYFNQAHLDVMAGVDHLIERGLADGDRMAKMGWSAGGHMTNKIITHTDRFKAASSGAGAVNWISMYGQSDVRFPRTPWFGGTPWQEDAPIDAYWGNSPLKDIYRATTPTLVLVGENDARVPMAQSVELYRALRTNGVDTHLYVAPRAGHGWSELRHGLFKVNVELDWFERHVRGKKYVWETAPGDETPEEETE